MWQNCNEEKKCADFFRWAVGWLRVAAKTIGKTQRAKPSQGRAISRHYREYLAGNSCKHCWFSPLHPLFLWHWNAFGVICGVNDPAASKIGWMARGETRARYYNVSPSEIFTQIIRQPQNQGGSRSPSYSIPSGHNQWFHMALPSCRVHAHVHLLYTRVGAAVRVLGVWN